MWCDSTDLNFRRDPARLFHGDLCSSAAGLSILIGDIFELGQGAVGEAILICAEGSSDDAIFRSPQGEKMGAARALGRKQLSGSVLDQDIWRMRIRYFRRSVSATFHPGLADQV